jgi:MarR family transcriptional regulator, organic hydroperoxide resistance regulator
MKQTAVESLLGDYPKIFLACHTRHVRDPKTEELVSAGQASILDHLDEIDGIGLNDLARHMGVTPGTMSITIDRLVSKGYVVRGRDKEDGRRVRLRLTAAGVRVRDAQTVLDPELVAALLARLSPEEQEEGLRGLAILAKAAGELLRTRSEGKAWAQRRSSTTTTQEKSRRQ